MTAFRRVVVASGLSNLADGVFQVALPLVALTITRDPAAFASVTVVGRLPWLLVVLPAGALADRLDRRRTMLAVNVARATLLGLLAGVVAAEQVELWILYVVAFGLGVGETFFDTAAQSVVPAVVPAHDLTRANGRLYAVELTANQFVGPPLGGFLAGIGLALALTTSATAYALGALVLALIAGSFRPERAGPPTRLRSDIVEGARYLWRRRVLRTLALCTGLSNLTSTAAMTILPLHAVAPGPMGLDETGFGLLLTTMAVGSVLGTLVADRVEARLGRTSVLVLASVLFPLMSLGPAVSDSPWVVGGLFVASGVGIVLWNVVAVSLRQRITPDHLLGRVNAGYRLMAWGTMPLGAVLGGAVAASFGVTEMFWVVTVLGLLVVPLLLSGVSDGAIEAAERDGAAAGAD